MEQHQVHHQPTQTRTRGGGGVITHHDDHNGPSHQRESLPGMGPLPVAHRSGPGTALAHAAEATDNTQFTAGFMAFI